MAKLIMEELSAETNTKYQCNKNTQQNWIKLDQNRDKHTREFLCNSEENWTNSFKLKFLKDLTFGEELKFHAEKLKTDPTLNIHYSAITIWKGAKLM